VKALVAIQDLRNFPTGYRLHDVRHFAGSSVVSMQNREGGKLDGYRFDYIVRRLARSHTSRRTALKSGGLGVTAAVLALAGIAKSDRGAASQASPVAATPADAVKTADGWLCKQRYALCTQAPCEHSASGSDDKTVSCDCVVEDGYSFGFTGCAERTPEGDSVISTFSTQDVTASVHEMSCPDGSPWANCLDMPCKIDPDDPKKATCQCEVVESGQFGTMGGDCDTSTCSSVIWSANTPTSPVVPQFQAAMKQLDQPVTLPKACPGSAATPVST
jgi:hypothetical protein